MLRFLGDTVMLVHACKNYTISSSQMMSSCLTTLKDRGVVKSLNVICMQWSHITEVHTYPPQAAACRHDLRLLSKSDMTLRSTNKQIKTCSRNINLMLQPLLRRYSIILNIIVSNAGGKIVTVRGTAKHYYSFHTYVSALWALFIQILQQTTLLN